LTEKPSAARSLAAALGGMRGQFNGEGYVIAHARGHLYEFVAPHRMLSDPALTNRYQRWDLAHLPWEPADFTWQLETIRDAGDVALEVKKVLSGCDELVIATDVDPSGEGGMIAVNAFRQLHLRPRTWSRMYFTDEAPLSLQTAFVQRRAIPDLETFDEYLKAEYRSKFDFLSMQWTRCATALARTTGRDVVLRQGRLKSAMVTLVGDQLKAHLEYVKKPYFQNRFRDENGILYINPDEARFDDPAQVPQGYAASAVVVDSSTVKRTAPPKLLDLAGLSALLVGTEGTTAKAVLETYQRMYEAQVVSYPRTEDKTITPAQFDELLPLVDRIAELVDVDGALLTHRAPRATHVKAQGAHGANRPGPNVPASLDEVTARFGQTGRRIYEVLARNYLAILAGDYTYEQQRGHLRDYPVFVGIANVPRVAGWKAVFDPEADADSAGDASAEDSEESDSTVGLGGRAVPFVFEGVNKRPEHPSMRWLMKQLDKRDVGTGATRTSTYSDVTSTATAHPLLVEKGRKVAFAPAGLVSWRLLQGTHIGDLALTEKVYADMREIAAGTSTADDRLAVVARLVREDIATMSANAAALGRAKDAAPEREKVSGEWAGREVTFGRVWGGHRFTDDEVSRLLAGETIEFQAHSAQGTAYDVFGALADQEHNGHAFVGFTKHGFGRRDANGAQLPPRQWCSHQFTAKEIATLMAGGSVTASDFVSPKAKTRKPFTCTLTFAEKQKGEGRQLIPTFS
jgi:DNA topoisomerase-3